MSKASFWRFLLRFLELPLHIRAKIKKILLIHSFQSVGSNIVFDSLDSVFPSDGKTQIGNNVFIGRNAYWGGEIHIGNNVMFGPNSTLTAGNHIFAMRGKSPRFIKPFPGQNSEPIVVEDEAWIGANVVVLGNVTIGIGAVIGAGSVVVHDIGPFTVSVGNPCHPVRKIFDDETLLLHLIELGYSSDFAEEVLERREKLLEGVNIPSMDKTDVYKSVIYEVL